MQYTQTIEINSSNQSLYTFDSDKINFTAAGALLKLLQDDIDFTEDFADDTDFTYDNTKAEFSGGQVQQKLYEITGLSFNEDFADDTGHTYDSDLAEFISGLIRQKNKRLTDETFYASYNTDINGNVGNGVLTGTAYNGAGITAGKLDLSGSANKYIDYDADQNADSQQTGCVRFKWTPKYSGAGSFQYLFTIVQAAGNANNRIRIYHQSTLLFYVVSDSTGSTIVSVAEAFSPVADTEYEIELNWDVTNGATRLFVNGTQLGTTQTGTGTRSADIGLLRLGKDLNGNGNADFLIDDLLIFSTPQHTSNYTPDWTNVYEYDYVTSIDELPTMTYSGNSLNSFTGFTATESGTPRYILDNKYWSGAAWVSSNDDYSQANTSSDVNTNISSLTPTGTTLNIKIVFDDSNSISSVSDITIGYTGNTYLETSVVLPEMQHVGVGTIKLFNSLAVTYSGSPRILLEIGRSGNKLYWNGSSWVASDLTYLQATNPTTFDTNCTSLDVDGKEYGQFTIVFPDSITQSSVSELTANMNVDIGYDQNNPTIEDVTTYSMVELINFLEDVTKSGNDNVKTILKKDNQWYYNNAGTWTVTDGETYAESNSASEILTYASLFPGEEATVKIKRFLHSDDGQTTPQINSNTITYEGVAPIESSKVYNYLEGYGIDTSVITASWIVQRINYLIIPWIEKNTRLKLDAETETTEYLSGTGKEILMLSKKPVNELVSISYVRSSGTLTDLANMVELDQNEGQLIAKNNPSEGLFGVVFEKGNKNIKVTYKYGMNDFVDPITENTADDIKEAVIYMAAKQMLIQIGARTGGGSLTVQSHSRNYGPRGKFTDIINNLDMMAYEILKGYFTGVAGS